MIPTPAELSAVDSVEVTPNEYATVIAHGHPLRYFNGNGFPLVGQLYAVKNWASTPNAPSLTDSLA